MFAHAESVHKEQVINYLCNKFSVCLSFLHLVGQKSGMELGNKRKSKLIFPILDGPGQTCRSMS